jgi:hypothetical protein
LDNKNGGSGMKKLITLLLLLGGGSVLAAPIIIDFEDQTVSTQGPFATDAPEYGTVDGFRFYRPDGMPNGGWIDPASIPMTGNGSSVALDWCDLTCTGTGTVAMETASGGRFDLLSFDFVSGWLTHGGPMEVIGYRNSGGTVSTSLVTVGPDLPWDTAVVDWTNLIRVEFIVPTENFNLGFLDNVVVDNVVPIPAAVWLFGSALAGLGWMRRKQTGQSRQRTHATIILTLNGGGERHD